MTDKRFQGVYIIDNMLKLRDNGVVKVFKNERLEELLNELVEENEELKKELSEQGTQLDFLKDENIHMREVLNENKQLKKENDKIKSLLLKKIEQLNIDYERSARAGMPTGAIIGELDSFEELCEKMGWIE